VALGSEFDRLRQTLYDTGRDQAKAQQEMRAATEAIVQMTQDVINMHQLSQGVLEHFRDYVTDMDASRAQVDETNRKTIELLEAMNKTSGQQAMYLSRLQEYQAALSATSQQYSVWADKMLSDAQEQSRQTAAELERVAEQMRDSAKVLADGSDAFAARTQESMARTTALFDESVSSSVRELNDTLARMRETVQLMPQLLSQSRERYAEQVDQFVTALVRLQKSMEKVSSAADGAAQKGKE